MAIALLWMSSSVVPVVAQSSQEDRFVNPLEEPVENDPLLPRLVVQRPLSPQERQILTTALDELNRQAQAKLNAGDVPGAFDIWNRELRLRRVLGAADEVDSLSRVGEVAWRQTQTTEVRIITGRLQQIQQEVEAQTPVNYDLLLKIAGAYEQMRAFDPAVGLYNQILGQARQQKNRPLEQKTLLSLGQLNLAWFNYADAATAYQDLLGLAKEDRDPISQINYLKQLAYIYQQSNQLEQAIAAQKQLVTLYERQQQYGEISPVKLSMGDAYLALKRPDLAAPSYQEAFSVARSQQQYGYAGDALQRLADLYRSLNRLDDALVVYRLLLDVRQQSYDVFGIMNVYDQIGQVYRTRGNAPQAIASFQRALQLAQRLSYPNKVTYFTAQIQQLNQPPTQPPAGSQAPPPGATPAQPATNPAQPSSPNQPASGTQPSPSGQPASSGSQPSPSGQPTPSGSQPSPAGQPAPNGSQPLPQNQTAPNDSQASPQNQPSGDGQPSPQGSTQNQPAPTESLPLPQGPSQEQSNP